MKELTGVLNPVSGLSGEVDPISSLMSSIMIPKAATQSLIISKTTAEWNSDITFISEKNKLYVYTDYYTNEDGTPRAGIKVGDGKAYLIDIPVITTSCEITPEDVERWNNKISCMLDSKDKENLILFK